MLVNNLSGHSHFHLSIQERVKSLEAQGSRQGSPLRSSSPMLPRQEPSWPSSAPQLKQPRGTRASGEEGDGSRLDFPLRRRPSTALPATARSSNGFGVEPDSSPRASLNLIRPISPTPNPKRSSRVSAHGQLLAVRSLAGPACCQI
jgi:hypothetical protein